MPPPSFTVPGSSAHEKGKRTRWKVATQPLPCTYCVPALCTCSLPTSPLSELRAAGGPGLESLRPLPDDTLQSAPGRTASCPQVWSKVTNAQPGQSCLPLQWASIYSHVLQGQLGCAVLESSLNKDAE